MAAAGLNPYALPPAAPELAPLRDEIWRRLPHTEVPTVYPPLAIAAFSIASRLPFPLLAVEAPGDRRRPRGLRPAPRAGPRGWACPRGGPSGTPGTPWWRWRWRAWGTWTRWGWRRWWARCSLLTLRRAVPSARLPAPRPGPSPSSCRSSRLPLCGRAHQPARRLSVPGDGGAAWWRSPSCRCWPRPGGVPPGLLTYGVSWEFNGPLFEPLWRLLDAVGAAPALRPGARADRAPDGDLVRLESVYPYLYPQLLAKALLGRRALAGGRRLAPGDAIPSPGRGASSGALLLLSATVYPWYLLWVLPWAALRPGPGVAGAFGADPALLSASGAGVPLLPWVYLAIWGPFFAAAGARERPLGGAMSARLTLSPTGARLRRLAAAGERPDRAAGRGGSRSAPARAGPSADRGRQPHGRRGPRPRAGRPPGAAAPVPGPRPWSMGPTTTCPRTCG